MINNILSAIHSNPLVAIAAILLGVIFDLSLALSDWKSKFTIGGIITTLGGAIASFTAGKIDTLEKFFEENTLVIPILYTLDIALIVFLLALFFSTIIIFCVNYIRGKLKNDPETFVKAGRRAFSIFGNGLYHYVVSEPDLVSANKIRDLEKHIDVLTLIQRTMVQEVNNLHKSEQHFKDSVDAVGRLLLQYSFNDSADLQKFRMAFFEIQNDWLEYKVAINNRDWTSHSNNGFESSKSFVGHAIMLDKPLIYPKNKIRKIAFEKRKDSRYKSFIAIPVPCGQGSDNSIGAITVDYTGGDSVFTELHIEELFSLSQLVYMLYVQNIKGKS
jgi:hypothetical protein